MLRKENRHFNRDANGIILILCPQNAKCYLNRHIWCHGSLIFPRNRLWNTWTARFCNLKIEPPYLLVRSWTRSNTLAANNSASRPTYPGNNGDSENSPELLENVIYVRVIPRESERERETEKVREGESRYSRQQRVAAEFQCSERRGGVSGAFKERRCIAAPRWARSAFRVRAACPTERRVFLRFQRANSKILGIIFSRSYTCPMCFLCGARTYVPRGPRCTYIRYIRTYIGRRALARVHAAEVNIQRI